MKYDSQADVVLRKTAMLLHIKNAPNGVFLVVLRGFGVVCGQKWYESVGF